MSPEQRDQLRKLGVEVDNRALSERDTAVWESSSDGQTARVQEAKRMFATRHGREPLSELEWGRSSPPPRRPGGDVVTRTTPTPALKGTHFFKNTPNHTAPVPAPPLNEDNSQ